MKFSDIKLNRIVQLRQNQKLNHIYEIELKNIEQIKMFDSFECHLVLYPLHRKINSNHIRFRPFEEYVEDIAQSQKSIYLPINDNSRKFFGFLLGGIITFGFAWFKPQILVSVESIVAIFGAYTFGKEFWEDIEALLFRLTSGKKISYTEPYYSYKLQKRTTLTRYSAFARQKRHENTPVLPQEIDFIEQSSSQTMRMKFIKKEFDFVRNNCAHILSIHVDPALLEYFGRGDFMLGVKLSFNKHFFGFKKHFEVFQSSFGDIRGCLNNNDEWINDSIFYRKTNTFGKLKFFRKKGFFKDQYLITSQFNPTK